MNKKLAGLALVIGSSFLFAPTDANAQFRRNRTSDTPSYSAPANTNTSPVIQIYDTKMSIGEKEKQEFKGYLEKRVKTAQEMADILTHQYMVGVISFDDFFSESSKYLVYDSALEAIASGDKNIYDMILHHTAWDNDILVGLNKDLIKKNLDKKYVIAEKVYEIVDRKFKSGMCSQKDVLKARGSLEDLDFLYKILSVKQYEEPRQETPKIKLPKSSKEVAPGFPKLPEFPLEEAQKPLKSLEESIPK